MLRSRHNVDITKTTRFTAKISRMHSRWSIMHSRHHQNQLYCNKIEGAFSTIGNASLIFALKTNDLDDGENVSRMHSTKQFVYNKDQGIILNKFSTSPNHLFIYKIRYSSSASSRHHQIHLFPQQKHQGCILDTLSTSPKLFNSQ